MGAQNEPTISFSALLLEISAIQRKKARVKCDLVSWWPIRSALSGKMFISSEGQILFHSEHASENVIEAFKSTSSNLNPDSVNGSPAAAEFPDSPPVSTIYTDVGVIPEHEKNEQEQLISNLERIVSRHFPLLRI